MPSSKAKTLCGDAKIKHEYHKDCLKVTPLGELMGLEQGDDKMRIKKAHLKATDGKEKVKFYTNEGMTEMIVPSKDVNYYPRKIPLEELQRLQKQAIVLTEADRLRMQVDYEKEKRRLEEESNARKNYLQQFDLKGAAGVGGARLSEMEREAKDKANYLLKRAWELKKEDEDEIKYANSLILKTKCQAIRDAQLAEHHLIQKEMKEEEKRIERLMEDEKTRAILEERRKMEELTARKRRYVTELDQQVEDIQARRLLEAEMVIEERKRVNEAMYLVMFEELERMRQAEEQKRLTRDALNQANEAIKRAQEIEKEESRIADLKMQEYMRLKAEREEKHEREVQEERKKKELETARLRALQEKAGDLQALQDEMAAVRRQEEYEREWRRKEKMEALKRQQMEEEIRLGREKQVQDIHKVQAMEIAREKREFERIIRVQMEIQEKERLLELKRKHESEVYRQEILKQINEKEKDRIEERQQKFAEGMALKAEDAKRTMELRQILEKKIDQLRQHKVPEMYIAEIQRQLKLTKE